MRLTVYSDYSLRLLMYLAVRTERLSTIQEVAKAYDVSSNHMMKVVHQLGLAGYVETVRGRNGGIRLGKPPSDIGLGELLRFTEPDMDIVPCFSPDNQDCPLRRACRLKGALDKAPGVPRRARRVHVGGPYLRTRSYAVVPRPAARGPRGATRHGPHLNPCRTYRRQRRLSQRRPKYPGRTT
jgi:Rrf2 family nitric oxide-sensitive transcriptional repressor